MRYPLGSTSRVQQIREALLLRWKDYLWNLAFTMENCWLGKISGNTAKDWYQQACVYFLEQLEHYDPTRGVQVQTYVLGNVKNLLWNRALRDNGLIRVKGVNCIASVMAAHIPAGTMPTGEHFEPVSHEREPAYEFDELDRLHRALRSLHPRFRTVVELRNGLKGGGELTLTDVGKRLGVTRERVRQMEKQAMQKLKNALAR